MIEMIINIYYGTSTMHMSVSVVHAGIERHAVVEHYSTGTLNNVNFTHLYLNTARA